MSASGNGTLTHATKCRLMKADGTPCGFTVTDHPMNVEIIGQPDARAQRFIEALMKHTAKKHPEAFQLAQMHGQFFFAYLTLGLFECPDPALMNTRAKFEQQLRRYVTPHAVTDDEIESALGALKFTMEDPKRDAVKFALRHLRNYYEGTPSNPPSKSSDSLLITP